MLSNKDKESLDKAIFFQKKGKNKGALLILKNLIFNNPEDLKVISILGLLLSQTENYIEAIPYLEKASRQNIDNELLSLSLYVSYSEINDFDQAFSILFRYLEINPAKLFKDSLIELLDGLLNGYGTDYRNEIIKYSRKNNITVPKELL